MVKIRRQRRCDNCAARDFPIYSEARLPRLYCVGLWWHLWSFDEPARAWHHLGCFQSNKGQHRYNHSLSHRKNDRRNYQAERDWKKLRQPHHSHDQFQKPLRRLQLAESGWSPSDIRNTGNQEAKVFKCLWIEKDAGGGFIQVGS